MHGIDRLVLQEYLLIHDDMHMYCYSLLYILKTPELDLGTPKVITSKANYATPNAATSTKGTSTHNYHHNHEATSTAKLGNVKKEHIFLYRQQSLIYISKSRPQ